MLLSLLAMPGDQSVDLALKALNKGSAKTASFKARILHGRTVSWEYESKYTGEKKKGCKYEVFLVGEDPKYYLKASVKVKNEQEATKVGAKYMDGTAWRLSKVALDTHTNPRYLHTPVKLYVDLEKFKNDADTSRHAGGAVSLKDSSTFRFRGKHCRCENLPGNRYTRCRP